MFFSKMPHENWLLKQWLFNLSKHTTHTHNSKLGQLNCLAFSMFHIKALCMSNTLYIKTSLKKKKKQSHMEWIKSFDS